METRRPFEYEPVESKPNDGKSEAARGADSAKKSRADDIFTKKQQRQLRDAAKTSNDKWAIRRTQLFVFFSKLAVGLTAAAIVGLLLSKNEQARRQMWFLARGVLVWLLPRTEPLLGDYQL